MGKVSLTPTIKDCAFELAYYHIVEPTGFISGLCRLYYGTVARMKQTFPGELENLLEFEKMRYPSYRNKRTN